MKLTLKIILLVLTTIGSSIKTNAQIIVLPNDSSLKSIDVSGQFNNAEIHLPGVKKQPEFSGGKKAWQDFLRSNINITIPFTNLPQGIYIVNLEYYNGEIVDLKILKR